MYGTVVGITSLQNEVLDVVRDRFYISKTCVYISFSILLTSFDFKNPYYNLLDLLQKEVWQEGKYIDLYFMRNSCVHSTTPTS